LFPGWLMSPHFHAPFASRVHVLGGVRDGDCAHHLAVVQSVDLSGVSGDPRTYEGVRGKRHRLELALAVHVERVGPATLDKTLDVTRPDLDVRFASGYGAETVRGDSWCSGVGVAVVPHQRGSTVRRGGDVVVRTEVFTAAGSPQTVGGVLAKPNFGTTRSGGSSQIRRCGSRL
jgi:hypothetical protein